MNIEENMILKNMSRTAQVQYTIQTEVLKKVYGESGAPFLTTRELAKRYSVSVVTAQHIMVSLRDEGYIKPVSYTHLEAGFTCPLQIVADSVTAHAGALDGNAGIVLIAGTGSICFAQRETGEQLQIGGNGHLIDDGGSGYDLSIQMLRAVVKAQDGRAPATILQDLVLEHLKLADVSFLIDWLYDEKRTKKEIAALAVSLDRALQHQDQAAQKIVQNAAASLAELALPAISFLNGRAALALSGSVLKKNAAVRDSLIHCLRERYPEEDQLVLISPKHEADYGAVLLAKRLAHRNIP